ncbi:hypothetical protein AWM68_04390 [Fictibacillus phosphorivorans]|uniref:Uncharacterized protein n=1 Tax=Fictibacillus phosphorivorans TaxID=1221500 RepID=A0A165NPM8_9BACL|nr:hypothetical protein [Fictibacillus phosphorivorans]KZE67103.1 hypothetical protein AWM68_04390 [Fictibacillus phosphorivorans]
MYRDRRVTVCLILITISLVSITFITADIFHYMHMINGLLVRIFQSLRLLVVMLILLVFSILVLFRYL